MTTTAEKEGGTREPLDRCPYAGRGTDAFNVCIAFTPCLYVGLDLQYRPLPPVTTCRHLTPVSRAGGAYPGCALGDQQGRENWAHATG